MNETKTMYSVDHIADGFSSTLNMPQLSRDDFEFADELMLLNRG